MGNRTLTFGSAVPNILSFLYTCDEWDTSKVDNLILSNFVDWGSPSCFTSLGFQQVLTQPSQMHLSNVQNLHWLSIIGDYTHKYIGDFHNPLAESLSTSQYKGTTRGFEHCSCEFIWGLESWWTLFPLWLTRLDGKQCQSRTSQPWGIIEGGVNLCISWFLTDDILHWFLFFPGLTLRRGTHKP